MPKNQLIGFAQTVESVITLLNQGFVEENKVINGYTLPAKIRWAVVKKSVGYSVDNAKELLEIECSRDSTDRGFLHH